VLIINEKIFVLMGKKV